MIRNRLKNEEIIRNARAARLASQELLKAGNVDAAIAQARQAYALSRSNRGHQLTSEAWLALVEALSESDDLPDEYREYVEGLFYWAETMADEIQLWLYPALERHLEELGLDNLVARAQKGRLPAEQWINAGNFNVSTRIQAFHLEDVAAGRTIAPKALAIERQAAFYIDEIFDADGIGLQDAATAWDEAGRTDRAEFLRNLMAGVAAARAAADRPFH